MNILILGASGGIGQALTQAIQAKYPDATLYGTYHQRKPDLSGVELRSLDVTDDRAIKSFAENFEQLDWLINCTGLLHQGDKGPEKSARQLEPDFILENFRRNTLPTMLLAKHFQSALRKSGKAVFASLSARVGSISDNGLGGWYSYRGSKAALNMFIKGLAIEWQRAVPNCSVAALHPGTVDTALSEPFQKRVPDEQLMSPDTAAEHLLEVIEGLSPDNSGGFWAWDGQSIPW